MAAEGLSNVDRPSPVRHSAHDRDASLQRVPQARRLLAHAATRGSRRGRARTGRCALGGARNLRLFLRSRLVAAAFRLGHPALIPTDPGGHEDEQDRDNEPTDGIHGGSHRALFQRTARTIQEFPSTISGSSRQLRRRHRHDSTASQCRRSATTRFWCGSPRVGSTAAHGTSSRASPTSFDWRQGFAAHARLKLVEMCQGHSSRPGQRCSSSQSETPCSAWRTDRSPSTPRPRNKSSHEHPTHFLQRRRLSLVSQV